MFLRQSRRTPIQNAAHSSDSIPDLALTVRFARGGICKNAATFFVLQGQRVSQELIRASTRLAIRFSADNIRLGTIAISTPFNGIAPSIGECLRRRPGPSMPRLVMRPTRLYFTDSNSTGSERTTEHAFALRQTKNSYCDRIWVERRTAFATDPVIAVGFFALWAAVLRRPGFFVARNCDVAHRACKRRLSSLV